MTNILIEIATYMVKFLPGSIGWPKKEIPDRPCGVYLTFPLTSFMSLAKLLKSLCLSFHICKRGALKEIYLFILVIVRMKCTYKCKAFRKVPGPWQAVCLFSSSSLWGLDAQTVLVSAYLFSQWDHWIIVK